MEPNHRTEFETDERAVLDHLVKGTPLDPEVARRVRERGAKITEELRREHGQLDVATDLVREVRDEA